MLSYLAPPNKNPKSVAAKADAILLSLLQRPPLLTRRGLAAPSAPPKTKTGQRPDPKPSQRLRPFLMRRRRRFHAYSMECRMVACMEAVVSTVMKSRRMVVFPQASRKGNIVLPKAKVVGLRRQWLLWSQLQVCANPPQALVQNALLSGQPTLRQVDIWVPSGFDGARDSFVCLSVLSSNDG